MVNIPYMDGLGNAAPKASKPWKMWFDGIVWGFWVGFRSWIFKNCSPTLALILKWRKHYREKNIYAKPRLDITAGRKSWTLINGLVNNCGYFTPIIWSSNSTWNWFFRGQKACSQQQKGAAARIWKKCLLTNCVMCFKSCMTTNSLLILDVRLFHAWKKVKHILPNGRLIVIYHGTR